MSVVIWKNGGLGVTPAAVASRILALPRIEMAGPSNLWLDITNLWRNDDGAPIVLKYGIQGSDPTDRVASGGSLQWQLDNGARFGNPLGYTSPFSHGGGLSLWRLNVGIRFSIGRMNGPRQFKLEGELAEALPSPDGPHGERRTYATALDWWDRASVMGLPDQPAQANQTPGQLMTTLINTLPLAARPPGNHVIDNGSEAYPWGFDGDGQITVRERINDIELSELGYAYIRGGPTGTQFVSESRQRRSGNQPVLFALDDSMITAIVAPGSRDDIYDTIRVHVYPPKVDTSIELLYELNAPVLVKAGQNLTTLFGPYRSTSGDVIGATNEIPPVAGTDYTANTLPDGSGTDLTAALVVVPAFTGVGVRFAAIQNTGVLDAWVTRLQVRGNPLVRTESVVERSATTNFGVKLLDLVMPYQANMNTATDIANVYAALFSQPYPKIEAVRFCANRSATLFDAAVLREPGDRITVTETMSGITNQPFTINSVQLEIYGNGLMWCTWGLEQASALDFWRMGADLLGVGTRLGF